jgi:hypothetical protein
MSTDLPTFASGAENRSTPRGEPVSASIRPSKAGISLLDKIRTRFNLPVEVLDANLSAVSPGAGADFYAAVNADPAVREQAAAVLKTARPQIIKADGAQFQVQPLRAHGRGRRPIGLLSLRMELPLEGQALATVLEPWMDLLRSTLESDLALVEGLGEERLEARRAIAALRFMGQTSAFETEAEVIRAIIHAAAVWFDVDARVYRRTLGGDRVLHAHLPGAPVPPEAEILLTAPPPPGRLRRVPFLELSEDLRWSTGDVVLASLGTDSPEEWVLTLAGSVPTSAEPLITGLAQTLASQLTVRLHRRMQAVRDTVQRIITRADTEEQIAQAVLAHLAKETGATCGALTLHTEGTVHRLALFGNARPTVTVPRDPLLAPDQLIYPLGVRDGVVVIDLRTEGTFTLEASRVLQAAAQMLHVWVVGRDRSRAVSMPAPIVDFAKRIGEELERAKRFDLRLSMVLIDLDGGTDTDAGTLARVVDAVRLELRGSDLLGVLDRGRIAALLVHTDAAGMTSVVPRLRRRVADVSHAMGVGFPRMGRAVFSDACRTPVALVSEAERSLEPVA